MPPPADSAPKAWKTYRSLGRGLQLSRMSEDEGQSPGTIKKRTLQERRKHQGPEVENSQSGKNVYWTSGHPLYPGTGQADQCGSPSSEAQDTG